MRRESLPVLLMLLACGAAGADQAPVATWSFEPGGADQVLGFQSPVPGVSGKGLRFDGQTTTVVRAAALAPRLPDSFSVEAWVAIQEYPWTWCAIVNQEKDHAADFLGIDPEGHFGLQLAAGGAWQESRSDVGLPLYTWNHVLATFDPLTGIKLYLNGKAVGARTVSGKPRLAPEIDAWVGRNHTPLDLSHEIKVVAPVSFSFNGILDEIKLYARALTAVDAHSAYASLEPAGPAPLRPPVLPAGPPGPGRFGAYYTRLEYAEEWERPWRVGDAADVVVRFDETPNRLVFWRGTSYIPAWVTENGIWYTNEFYETQSQGMPTSAEPMADKQARFSHARILESNDARVVVLWRYAPVSVDYDLVNVDPLDGWGDWVEEYFTVYPDGSCVRKINVWSSSPRVVPGEGPGSGGFRQYHEAIIINPPGTRPEDNIKTAALTLANMKGETHTYSWEKGAPGAEAHFDPETLELLKRISDLEPETHRWLTEPGGGNILRVNLKARYSPYVVVDPRQVAIDCYAGEIRRERSIFPWWNHWPVSQQIRSNGRWAVAPDRVSHSSLAHIQSWRPFGETEHGITMLMLNGLTEKSAAELVPLASSWLKPPPLEAVGPAFRSEGFDPTQRAYVLTRPDTNASSALEATLRASSDSPAVNPVLLIRGWGLGEARIEIDGQATPPGKDVRVGHIHRLDGDDLVLWLRREATAPLRISVSASR